MGKKFSESLNLVYSGFPSHISDCHAVNLKMLFPLSSLPLLSISSAVVVVKLGKLSMLSELETVLKKNICIY